MYMVRLYEARTDRDELLRNRTNTQDIERVNSYFEGDLLTFQERNTFTYLPYKTTGAHFHQVHVPNLPLLAVVSKAVSLDLPLIAQIPLNAALSWVNHPNAFLKLPVYRFLWGYEDTIVDTAKPFMSISGQLRYNKFGLLAAKNGNVVEKLTINTGQRDINRINIIEKLDGQTHLNYWGSPECNR
ncbi:Scavenger receptor class B member 1 [Eumeta japonica]|uniref:Scavenger receptor class B member 1 n=1 Tax=Eumeta variegata TaxID=151549 RepID=A0A4C1UFE9_EUMVA|nr:Scavenger receptor class B member 1 [Eumeta japonica]